MYKRQAQADGWAAGAEQRTVAYLAWAAVHGLAVLWLDGPLQSQEDRPFDAVAEAVSDLLNQSLAAERATPANPEGAHHA